MTIDQLSGVRPEIVIGKGHEDERFPAQAGDTRAGRRGARPTP